MLWRSRKAHHAEPVQALYISTDVPVSIKSHGTPPLGECTTAGDRTPVLKLPGRMSPRGDPITPEPNLYLNIQSTALLALPLFCLKKSESKTSKFAPPPTLSLFQYGLHISPVSMADFLPLPPIKRDPSRVPCIRREHNLKRKAWSRTLYLLKQLKHSKWKRNLLLETAATFLPSYSMLPFLQGIK